MVKRNVKARQNAEDMTVFELHAWTQKKSSREYTLPLGYISEW